MVPPIGHNQLAMSGVSHVCVWCLLWSICTGLFGSIANQLWVEHNGSYHFQNMCGRHGWHGGRLSSLKLIGVIVYQGVCLILDHLGCVVLCCIGVSLGVMWCESACPSSSVLACLCVFVYLYAVIHRYVVTVEF